MKIVELVVSRSEKVNTGNYTSKDYFVSLKAEVDYDENIRLITSKLFARRKVMINDVKERDST